MKTSINKEQVDGMPGAISDLGKGAVQEIAERDRHRDVATTSPIEVRIDQAERRTWFLAETGLGVA